MALPGTARAAEITVFAAASLKEALEEVSGAFAAATGHDTVLAFAGSSALARQIAQGAPADVFVSANTAWMTDLENKGLIEPGTRSDFLGNRLILIAHGAQAEDTAPEDLPALLGNRRLAMALVDAVPAGIYGRQALEALGLWQALAPQIAQADNARAALALVALGAAPFGIVYATDAAAEPRVSTVATFPDDSHAPIVYPAAIVAGHGAPPARAFLGYLTGAEAAAVFQRHGFTVLGG